MIRSLGSAGLALVTLGTGLGLYLVSYSVGAERSGIAKLERQIATDRRDPRAGSGAPRSFEPAAA